MIDWQMRTAQVIEVDTDGIYFTPPENIGADELRNGLAAELPHRVEFDDNEAMFSYKAKNYALLTHDGDVVIKGGALKSVGSKSSSAFSLRR
jgi:DNA polymerase elongation subunit (family B)